MFMRRIDRKYLLGPLLILICLLICFLPCSIGIESIKRNPLDVKPEATYAFPFDATVVACFNLESDMTYRINLISSMVSLW